MLAYAYWWITINWLSIIWKYNLSDKKQNKTGFFSVSVSILLDVPNEHKQKNKKKKKRKKKLGDNLTRTVRVILNNFLKQNRTKQLLYIHLPLIS